MVRVRMGLLDMGCDDRSKAAAPAPNPRLSVSRRHGKAEKPSRTGGTVRTEGPATELSLSSAYVDDPRAPHTRIGINLITAIKIAMLMSTMIGRATELTLDMDGSVLRGSAAALARGSGKALHGGARRSRMRTS